MCGCVGCVWVFVCEHVCPALLKLKDWNLKSRGGGLGPTAACEAARASRATPVWSRRAGSGLKSATHTCAGACAGACGDAACLHGSQLLTRDLSTVPEGARQAPALPPTHEHWHGSSYCTHTLSRLSFALSCRAAVAVVVLVIVVLAAAAARPLWLALNMETDQSGEAGGSCMLCKRKWCGEVSRSCSVSTVCASTCPPGLHWK